MSQNLEDHGSDHICSNSFKKHWAEAQIDSPMHEVIRYDDVAKLMITIGGFVLATMGATFAEILKERGRASLLEIKPWLAVLFGLMLFFFFCSAAVCFPQPKLLARQIIESKDDADLTNQIEDWCDDLLRILSAKRLLLFISTFSFIAAFLLMSWLLIRLI